jgi:hypothetical protein
MIINGYFRTLEFADYIRLRIKSVSNFVSVGASSQQPNMLQFKCTLILRILLLKREEMRNYYRLITLMIVVSLGLISGVVFAQDAEAAKPPTKPLVPCSTDNKGVCDMLATKADDIVGVWSLYFNAQPAFIRYNADGTWLVADTAEHTNAVSVDGFPYGTFSFDKDGIFTSLDPNTPAEVMPEECRGGKYLLRVIKVDGEPVALNMAVLDDCFVPRRTDWAYTLMWVGN